MSALELTSRLLPFLISWSGQVLVLAAAGALAALVIAHPKGRLWFWQALLLAMLLLPFIEPRKADTAVPSAAVEIVATASIAASPQAARFHWRSEDWLWLLAAGAVLRLAWVAIGLMRLRRYRREATPLPAPAFSASASVRWYSSDSVPGPATYGCLRPVILLPRSVLDLPAEIRRAIECHELIHVRRRDGLFVPAEAVLRSLLWFHPAIWFALSRIQLAREQVVDRESVNLLRGRESYLDALIAVAESRLQPDLAPAPLFLRKRHLSARVNALVKEINMSGSRILAAIAAVCAAVPIAAVAAVWWFPFVSPAVGQAQTAPDAPGISVEAGAPLLHRAAVRRPPGSDASGTVILQASLDKNGQVTDAKVLSGPEELRKDALSSVLQWHYQPGPAVAQISIQFPPPSANPVQAAADSAPPQLPPAAAAVEGRLNAIRITGLSPDAERDLRSRLPVHEGDSVTRQDGPRIVSAVEAFDRDLTTQFTTGANGAITGLSIRVGQGTAVAQAAPRERDGAYYPGDGITNPAPIYRPEPQYSEEARTAKWQGSVLLSTVIDKSGVPTDIKVVRPLGMGLDEKAVEALDQWRFKPGAKDGVPVPVHAQIEVSFRLR